MTAPLIKTGRRVKLLAMAGLGGVAAVAALFAAGPEFRRYPIPQSEALGLLSTTPLPEPLLDMSGHQVSLVRRGGTLVWYLGNAGHPSVGRVTIAGDGASTKVTVDFDLADNALGYSPVANTRLARSMAETIFTEYVDSALGRRPFDARLMMAAAREIQANPEMLKEYGEAVDDQFNDVATMLNGGATGGNMPRELQIDAGVVARESDKTLKPVTNSLQIEER